MKEEEIRPHKIFDKFLSIAAEDCNIFFSTSNRRKINCPACNSQGEHSFIKNSFSYELCPKCETLFVSPRPDEESFNNFYTNSSSAKYWATTFYKETENARKKLIWKDKIKLINNLVSKYSSNNPTFIDIGGGYGVFGEEMTRLKKDVIVIEPSPSLSKQCKEKNLKVINKFLEDVNSDELPKGRKVFVSFELFEHLYSPRTFLEKLYSLMTPGDLFIFTTLSSFGPDIRGLWKDSKSVSPPHHLNFFNPISIRILSENIGFSVKRVETPGKLDLDILKNSKDQIKDNFLKIFIEFSSENDKERLQTLISEIGYSSHMLTCLMK